MEGKERVEAAIGDFDAAIRYAKKSYRLQTTPREQEVAVWIQYSLKQVNSRLASALMKGPYVAEGESPLDFVEVREAGSQAKEVLERSSQAKFGKDSARFAAAVGKGLEEIDVHPYARSYHDGRKAAYAAAMRE